MSSWSIGEVARLLGVRPHVIRYWESELPLLSPPKGLSGRREYSAHEVQLLLRFRDLLYERKFTIEGAKRRLWEELGAGDPDIAARFAQVRAGLIDALMTVKRRRDRAGRVDVDEDGSMGEKELRERYEELGQRHLFDFWEARPDSMRARLLEDLASLDPRTLSDLRACLAPAAGCDPAGSEELVPAPYIARAVSSADRQAREAGEEEIRRGGCAFLTVAGGQGSRLGFEGPKGMFPVTPLRKLSLFALFAEKLTAARRRYGVEIPWLIMTGPQNHQATIDYFESEDWFGLGPETVRMFPQGMLPSLSPDGRLLMAPDGGLFFNPNGHGGVIDALRRSGNLARMRERGVRHLFYFQVDNPLVRVPDPVYLGFHLRAEARASAKVVEKAYPEEKLGVIATRDGVPCVIEYSDLDPARKKVKTLNPTAAGAEVCERDAVKMEMFIFDAIPLAGCALFFETERADEFAPLKNREGVDSIESCHRGQVEQAARWLEAVGVEVPRGADGRPLHEIEISPLFAPDPDVLAARRGILKDRIDEDTLLV